MFFAGLFAAYFAVRAKAPLWPPLNPETQTQFHVKILPLVGPATCPADRRSRASSPCGPSGAGDRVAFVRNIAVTFIIGITFLLMQVIDYAELGAEGPRSPRDPMARPTSR